jgi:parvulin-like peptidyl-prolyl isomerase
LAEPSALQHVVLWFSQIVIRHAQVRADVSFNLAYWTSVVAPERSRADALALAERVADLAAHEPTQFAELARQYSEDLASRDEGGALGGYAAVQLSFWPQVLDALSALSPGQTSKIVETPYGFHVFQRHAPAREESRSGAHIVIGHDAALWLSVSARRPRPRRTREAALALANDIYGQAASAPDRFGELVEKYSEHRDAVAAGDFGAWSTREPSAFPSRIKRLGELAVGQVGKPVETHLGFEIIQRTPARSRSSYRAAVLMFPLSKVNSDTPTDPSTEQRAAALHEAEGVARQLKADPSRFDALRSADLQWQEGRENPELTRALSRLQTGQLTPTPVDSEHGFLVAKRLEPEPVALSHFENELPAPVPADLCRFLAALHARDTLTFLPTFAASFAQGWALESTVRERFEALHVLTGLDEGAPLEARLAQISELFEQTQELLGSDGYSRYQSALSREAALLPLPADSERGPLGL